MKSFSEKVKKLRKEKGWSQETFAQQIHVHGRHVGKYETKKAMPNADTLVKIAQVFDVSIDYLLIDGENDNPRSKIKDKEMLNLFEHTEHLEIKDKEILKSLIDAYLKKQEMEKLMNKKMAGAI